MVDGETQQIFHWKIENAKTRSGLGKHWWISLDVDFWVPVRYDRVWKCGDLNLRLVRDRNRCLQTCNLEQTGTSRETCRYGQWGSLEKQGKKSTHWLDWGKVSNRRGCVGETQYIGRLKERRQTRALHKWRREIWEKPALEGQMSEKEAWKKFEECSE